MSQKEIDKDFSGQEFIEETVSDRIFLGDSFDRTYFGHRTFIRCVFIGCSFRLASFDRSNFIRCVFRGNDFCGAFGDSSFFEECHSALDNFQRFDFGSSRFCFSSTDGSSFANAIMPRSGIYPAGCREVVAEIIRKAGDAPWILSVAGLVHGWSEFCWETLVRVISETWGPEKSAILAAHLRQYPSLEGHLEKHLRILSNGR